MIINKNKVYRMKNHPVYLKNNRENHPIYLENHPIYLVSTVKSMMYQVINLIYLLFKQVKKII